MSDLARASGGVSAFVHRMSALLHPTSSVPCRFAALGRASRHSEPPRHRKSDISAHFRHSARLESVIENVDSRVQPTESGEALRVVESPLRGKVKDRQTVWGDTWEDALTFVCQIVGNQVDDLEAQWIDTTPDNAKELTEVSLNKQAFGISKEQILKELGCNDSQIDAESRTG